MRRFTQLLLILPLLTGATQRLAAFGLLGPATTWQTARLGYNTNPEIYPPGQGWGGGGPMNIGEEYRYNVPTLTYSYSPAFLNYFGQRGVTEIDKVMNYLNTLPAADTIKIDDFPLLSQRVNHRAQTLQLVDVRSLTLSAMVNQLGLADPTRWVFTLRNRWIGPSGSPTNYYVIKRNFDPATWTYSSYVNGQLWTYNTILDGDTSFVVNEPVDPLALGGEINAPVASGVTGNGLLLFGGFWTGLTRDDVAGLQYMYRHNNYNIESAPTNVFGASSGAAVSTGSSSPWTIPSYGTNTTGTAIPGASTNFVNIALRPGIGRVQFVKVFRESVIGGYPSNTLSYTDTFVTNGVEITQTLIRSQQAPDVLFDAGDLQGDDAGSPKAFFINAVGTLAWLSPNVTTNAWGPGNQAVAVGAAPGYTLVFQNVGPAIWNIYPNFLSEINNATTFFRWSSFDGSQAEPLIYPDKESIVQIEDVVLGSGSGGVGENASAGSQVGTWTPASLILLPVGTGTTTGTGGTGGTGNTGTGMP